MPTVLAVWAGTVEDTSWTELTAVIRSCCWRLYGKRCYGDRCGEEKQSCYGAKSVHHGLLPLGVSQLCPTLGFERPIMYSSSMNWFDDFSCSYYF